jgi:serine/threonine-protein kinase
VYALGAILYELLSGKKPHPGESHNAILHHISTQPAFALAGVTEGLPPELVDVVMQALAPRVEDRPASAEAFALALAPWAAHERWPAPALDRATPAHAEPSSTELAPEHAAARVSMAPSLAVASVDRERTRSARSPWLAMAAGGAVVLVLVIVFGQRTPSRSAEPRASSAPASAAEPRPSEPLREAPPPEAPAALQIPSDAPLPSAAAASAIRPTRADTARTAPPPIRRVASPEPRVSVPREKPSAPAEPATAPVTFDQKNPYH